MSKRHKQRQDGAPNLGEGRSGQFARVPPIRCKIFAGKLSLSPHIDVVQKGY